MILLIDNYDSFTYNLYQEIRKLGKECLVKRNDKITTREVRRLRPRRIIISPGPGRPEEAGITLEVIRAFGAKIPILGDGLLMGVRHKTHPVEGVQFHPESVATPLGGRLLRNFIDG